MAVTSSSEILCTRVAMSVNLVPISDILRLNPAPVILMRVLFSFILFFQGTYCLSVRHKVYPSVNHNSRAEIDNFHNVNSLCSRLATTLSPCLYGLLYRPNPCCELSPLPRFSHPHRTISFFGAVLEVLLNSIFSSAFYEKAAPTASPS